MKRKAGEIVKIIIIVGICKIHYKKFGHSSFIDHISLIITLLIFDIIRKPVYLSLN